MNNMNNLYKELLQIVENYCKNSPKPGFEIAYLENAKELWELYIDAGLVLDEYEEENPDIVEEALTNILQQAKEIVQ